MSFVIFDVVILILLLLTAWKGYRRGFVLTLCSLLAVFVAFIGATVISSQLARPMSRLIQPALERSITQVLEEQTHAVLPPPETSEASQPPALSDAFSGEEGQEGEEDWLAQLPLDEVLDALQASSLYQHFIQPIQDAIQDGVMEVTTSAARAVADYLALELTRMFLFLVSFALVLLLWLLLSRVLDLACKLPVLSTLNHWSGAALGLVKGGLIVFILCWLSEGLPDLPGGGGGDRCSSAFSAPTPLSPCWRLCSFVEFLSVCPAFSCEFTTSSQFRGYPVFVPKNFSLPEGVFAYDAAHHVQPLPQACGGGLYHQIGGRPAPRTRDCASSAPRSWASSPSTT